MLGARDLWARALLHVLGPWSLGHRCSVSCPRGLLSRPGVGRSAPRREVQTAFACSLLKATPKVPTTPVKAKRVSTFQEFESNTSATPGAAARMADELLAMAAESLSTAVVMETAHRVLLATASSRRSRPPGPGAPGGASRGPAAGSLRLVKSVSESPRILSKVGGGGEGRVVGEGAAGFQKRPGALSPGDGGGEGPSPRAQVQRARASWSAEAAALPAVLLAGGVSLLMAWLERELLWAAGGTPPFPRMPWLLEGAFPARGRASLVFRARSPRPLPMISRSPTRGLQHLQGEVCSLESPGSILNSKGLALACVCHPRAWRSRHFRSLYAGGAETSDSTVVV